MDDDQIPFRKHLGIRFLGCENGEARLTMAYRPELGNRWGGVHGGAIFTLIDAAISSAILDRTGPTAGGVTIELKVNYLAPGKGDLTAVGRVVRMSSRQAVGTADVYDGEGAHVATGLGTFAIRQRDA